MSVGWDRQERGDDRGKEVEKVEKYEAQEVLVVSVAQTVVHKGAMMVEFLDATWAMSAMEGSPGFDDPAIETEVIQVNTFLIGKSQ